jgi:hypothetical protein
MSADPIMTASRWLLRHGFAKVGDGLEIHRTGVHWSYSLISADNEKPNDYPDDADDDPNYNEGDDVPYKEPKNKKTKKKAREPEDTCDKK